MKENEMPIAVVSPEIADAFNMRGLPNVAIRPMHTPGPWKLDGETIRGDNGWEVCNPFRNDSPMGLVEAGANAKLIMAAPNMLNALKSLIEWEGIMGGFDSERWIEARAAIAKAEGVRA